MDANDAASAPTAAASSSSSTPSIPTADVLHSLLRRRHKPGGALDAAGWLLKRRMLPPRRLWATSSTEPTKDCDLVLTLPAFPPTITPSIPVTPSSPSETGSQEGCQDGHRDSDTPDASSEAVLSWLLHQLQQSSPELLQATPMRHSSTGAHALYIRATWEGLLKAAEEAHLAKRLRNEFGGGWREFSRAEAHRFRGGGRSDGEEPTFFSTLERQLLARRLLEEELRAGPKAEIQGLRFREGQALVPKLKAAGLVEHVYPLHDLTTLHALRHSWVGAPLRPQPLDDIANYFGVKIGLYFAWIGNYTWALLFPALGGMAVWVCEWQCPDSSDALFVALALSNAAWASLWLEAWKRRSAALAYRWGTLDQRSELLSEPRPTYRGRLARSEVTGLLEPHFPEWRRNLIRYGVSLPVVSICLLVVFGAMLAVLRLQDWWDLQLEHWGAPYFLGYLPKVLLGLVIALLNTAYHQVALWLNHLENYRLEEQYQNHLTVKLVLFEFVNSFLSLFYIGFYLQDMERLREQLAALLITRQLLGNVTESVWPFVVAQLKLAHMLLCPATPDPDSVPAPAEDQPEPASSPRGQLPQAEAEAAMETYDGTFGDHLEMLIQFGYVVLFSCAFPPAAFCALLNNLLEIRSDAFKLCCVFRRPFAERVNSIGPWQDCMEAMGVLAVVVNCALIAISGQAGRALGGAEIPAAGPGTALLLVVALEHLMLALKTAISYAIPDIPGWVAREMAKAEFARRDAFQKACAAGPPSAPRLSPGRRASEAAREGPASAPATPGHVFGGRETPPPPSSPGSGRRRTPSPARGHPPSNPPSNPPSAPSTPPTPHLRSALRPSREFASSDTTMGRLRRPMFDASIAEEARVSHLVGSLRRSSQRGVGASPSHQGASASDPDIRCASAPSLPSSPALAAPVALNPQPHLPHPDHSSSSPSSSTSSPRRIFRFSPEHSGGNMPGSHAVTQSPLVSPKLLPRPTTPPPPAAQVASASTSGAPEEESLAVRKLKAKRSLLKRARSVSVFLLKPKAERDPAKEREKELIKEKEREIKEREKERRHRQMMGTSGAAAVPQGPPVGELGQIPLEKLIQIEDLRSVPRRRTNP